MTATPEQVEFLHIRDEFETLTEAWNRMTPENRLSAALAKDHFTVNNRDVTKAAEAFAAVAADRHKIEEVAKVYLVLGPNGWELDRPYDTDPLEGYDNGPLNEACDLDHGDELAMECEALRAAANYIWLPSIDDIRILLIEETN
jgi:hypothetical protein